MPLGRLFVLTFAMSLNFADTASANAIYGGGEDLARNCRAYMRIVRNNGKPIGSQEAYDAGQCLATAEATNDAMLFVTDKVGYCVPATTTNGALAEVVANYVEQHPEERHKSSVALILSAFRKSWPCE